MIDNNYIWKIKSYKPNPIFGLVCCIFCVTMLFFLLSNAPLNAVAPPVIFCVFAFFVGLYEVLKQYFLSYPIQINICEDSLEIVYSKGLVKQLTCEEIKRIAFEIRPPERGWWRLLPPRFEFYDSKETLVLEGDVPTYEQFQRIYSLLQGFQLRIFIPSYTEESYQKFFGHK